MTEFRFRVVIRRHAKNEQEILTLADELAEAGCDDAHLAGHREGIEIVFDRQAASRDEAMRSAIDQIETCGLAVVRIELDREAIAG